VAEIRDPYVTPPPQDVPVFNTFRRKVLRPFYSMAEFQAGVIILLLLAAVLGWVLWRGAHPDPALFSAPELEASAKPAMEIYEPPVEPWIEPGSARMAPASGAGSALEPFPASVVSDGWRIAAPVEMFDETNLYNKINGREGFYKGFGFQKLHFLGLVSERTKNLTIDIELFDQGSAENAIGALAAEASNPESPPRLEQGGLVYATRNGGFLSRGKYYARLVGSEDDPSIREKIAQLLPALRDGLPGADLPWAFALLAGELGLPAGKVRFERENVFSFGFATAFYLVKIPDAEAEIYVSRRGSEAEAAALAGKLIQGFAEYGKPVDPPTGAPDGARFLRHDYLKTIDAVASTGAFVIGVRLAKTPEEAAGWLDRLREALGRAKLPEATGPTAVPALEPVSPNSVADEYAQ